MDQPVSVNAIQIAFCWRAERRPLSYAEWKLFVLRFNNPVNKILVISGHLRGRGLMICTTMMYLGDSLIDTTNPTLSLQLLHVLQSQQAHRPVKQNLSV